MSTEIEEKLKAKFGLKDLEFREGRKSKDGSKVQVFVYIDARAVMRRLDEVVGAANWQSNIIVSNDGKIIVGGIGINFPTPTGPNWVWKYDGSGQTDFEGEKGGISGALKRAAVQWGIGQYLYDLPQVWVSTPFKRDAAIQAVKNAVQG